MKRITIFILPLLLVACHKPLQVSLIQTEVIMIDSTLDAIQDTDYLAALTPIREQLEEQLSMPLGTAPEAMEPYAPESPLMNWASDALYAMALQEYPGTVDCAIVNLGGLRCSWPAGEITFRNVFELMPFDNELVVLSLRGKDLLDLCDSFAKRGGEGNSAELRMTIHGDKAEQVTIHGLPVDPQALYLVATSDYLSTGTDGMDALTRAEDKWLSNEKIRDLYIRYIQQCTEQGLPIAAEIDGRTRVL